MLIALIGGTGVDEMPEFTSGTDESVATRFGTAEVLRGEIEGREVVFLPRHGRDHSVPPHLINYRAQIAALRKLGVDCAVGVCAVGSLTSDIAPGSFVVLSDFIDLTRHRIDTFFDCSGQVVHTDFTHPYCPCVRNAVVRACSAHDVPHSATGVYVGVEGPRYETPAEIRLYASWGGHVIGMTNTPEAILAREAGICYGGLAVVTNLAAGLSPVPLSHDEVRQSMVEVKTRLHSVVVDSVSSLYCGDRGCGCGLGIGLVM